VDPSDNVLVARVVLNDDARAFAEIVRRYQATVRRLARRLACGDHAMADDVAQETFLRAYRGIHTFDGRARLSTWLCAIAYRVFLAEAERASRARPTPEDDEPVTHSATNDTAHPALRPDIERALGRLRPCEREAIALTFGQDLSQNEAARILGCPLGTLKANVSRGLEKLERALAAWKESG
jgi:RNA polymerase sigma-70 factor (ECF subfamily)